MNMLQNVSVFTLCTAQMNMQLQNQNTLLNNLNLQHNNYRYSYPYQMPGMANQTPFFMHTRPPTAMSQPGLQQYIPYQHSSQPVVMPELLEPHVYPRPTHHAPVRPPKPHVSVENQKPEMRRERPHGPSRERVQNKPTSNGHRDTVVQSHTTRSGEVNDSRGTQTPIMVIDSPVSRDSHPEGKSCVHNRIRAEIKNHTWETPLVGLENSTPVTPQDLNCSPAAESYQAVPDSNPYTGSSSPKEKPEHRTTGSDNRGRAASNQVIEITSINIEGVKGNAPFLISLAKTPKIICLQETWLWTYEKEVIKDIIQDYEVLSNYYLLSNCADKYDNI